jgi:hypothetical protein
MSRVGVSIFNVGGHDFEGEVEANLIISRTGASVGYIIGSDLFCIFNNGKSLKIRSELTDMG